MPPRQKRNRQNIGWSSDWQLIFQSAAYFLSSQTSEFAKNLSNNQKVNSKVTRSDPPKWSAAVSFGTFLKGSLDPMDHRPDAEKVTVRTSSPASSKGGGGGGAELEMRCTSKGPCGKTNGQRWAQGKLGSGWNTKKHMGRFKSGPKKTLFWSSHSFKAPI